MAGRGGSVTTRAAVQSASWDRVIDPLLAAGHRVDRRRQSAARPRRRRRCRQRPGPHDRRAGRARRPLLRRRRDLERRRRRRRDRRARLRQRLRAGPPARTASGSRPSSRAAWSASRRRDRCRGATERPISTSLPRSFHEVFCCGRHRSREAAMPGRDAAPRHPGGTRRAVGRAPAVEARAVVVPDRRAGPHHPGRNPQRFMAARAGARRTIAIAGASHAVPVSRPDATVHPILEAAALRVAA